MNKIFTAGTGLARLLLLSLVLYCPGSLLAADGDKMTFDIPAQGADAALRQFSVQSGMEVLFSTAVAANVAANEVKGQFTPLEAVALLLSGTDLAIEQKDGQQGVLRVVRDAGPNVAGTTGSGPLTDRPDSDDVGMFDRVVMQDKFVVSASRTPQDPRYTSSSVSRVPLAELETTQMPDLRSSLAQQPGVIVVNTGTVGGQTSVYIRGAYPHHTLFIVDGVRMNDRSATYGNFLAGADLGGLDRIEILRGPQSPMYGSAAMGGVVLMDTSKGNDGVSGNVTVSGGSFDTMAGALNVQGGTGALGYSASIGRYETANDLPGNDYESWNYSGRFNVELTPQFELGLTLRGSEGVFQSVGSRFWPSTGTVDSANYLGTLYGKYTSDGGVVTQFTGAWHRREYTWTDSWGASPQENNRKILDWQTAWQAAEQLELVVGANYEDAEYDLSGGVTGDKVAAGFVSGTYRVAEDVTLTAGFRYDDFETVGSSTTWRTGLSWLLAPETKLRATYGTGFAAPGSSDRYGVPQWGQEPNPSIRPEESTGWDIGIDQGFLDEKLTLSASYFSNSFEDLIDWEYISYVYYTGWYVNRSKASTQGVELGITAQPVSIVQLRLGYTYLDAEDDTTGARLIRRPRHTLDAQGWVDITPAWTLGLGLHYVADRVDSGPIGDYTTVRAFTSWEAMEGLTLRLRAENLFDEEYEEVLGYPALPRGVFGSVEWSF